MEMEWKRNQWMAKIKRLMLEKEQRRRRALEEAEEADFWDNWQNNTAARIGKITPPLMRIILKQELREVAGFYRVQMDKKVLEPFKMSQGADLCTRSEG